MPDPQTHHSIFLASEDATDALGRLLAAHLVRGDTILLSGQIGAGKSQLSRAIIRERLGRMEDVPSPTFTLVQTYEDAKGDIWHADLYRLGHPDDVLELGLDDAFETAICLIEWPDRLGHHVPATAIHLSLTQDGDGRRAEFSFTGHEYLAKALMNV
jgi:tRNA threonylcarbamoyladenosine biosynthesis protein TsaE